MKKIFWAALLPMAFAACTNDELVVMENPEMEDGMITLGENFAIGVSREGAPETRLAYATSIDEIYWMPEDGDPTNTDKLGLSWLGVKDGKIYTNYQFDHFAWSIKWGEKPIVDPCTGKWNDLVFVHKTDYDNAAGTGSDYVTAWTATDGLYAPTTKNSTTPNLANGYFKTENLTIFGGEYMMYSPYNEELVNTCYLPVKANAAFDNVNAVANPVNTNAKKNLALKGLADEHFYVGYGTLKGGETANGFKMEALTGTINLQIKRHKDSGDNWKNIFKVAIYGKNGIIIEQEYDAVEKKLGKVLSTSTSLVSTLANPFDVVKDGHTLFIPAMPQTIENAVVVLFSGTGLDDVKSVMYNVGNIDIKSNSFTTVTVQLENHMPLQSNTYYVVDMETFQMAMTSAAYSSAGTVNIQLLNDIEYDQAYTTGGLGYVYVNKNMNISGGNIIVPAGQTPAQFLSLELMYNKTLTMDGKIIIEGQGNCDACAPTVAILGRDNTASQPGRIVLKQDVSVGKNATLTVGGENAFYTNIVFEEALTNDSKLIFTGNATVAIDSLVNNGIASMERTTTDIAHSVKVDSLVNAADAEFNVGPYTQLAINKALTNDGELNIIASGTGNTSTDGTVEITSAATASNNGTIDNAGVYKSVGTTTLYKGEFIDHAGSQYSNKQPTVGENAEYIYEVDGSTGERLGRGLSVDKKCVTIIRFVNNADAGKDVHEYQLANYASEEFRLAEVEYEVDVTTKDIVFKNNSKEQLIFGKNLTINSAANVTFNGGDTFVGGNMKVNAGNVKNNGQGFGAIVTVEKDLVLDKASVLTADWLKGATKGAIISTTPSWTVNGNLILNGSSRFNVEQKAAVKVLGNMTITRYATAWFNYNSYTKVGNKIDNNGKFDRVLSTGLGVDYNDAAIYCKEYTKGANGVETNGAPEY